MTKLKEKEFLKTATHSSMRAQMEKGNSPRFFAAGVAFFAKT